MMKKILFTLAIGIATLTSCESDSTTTPDDEVGVLLKKTIDDYEGAPRTTELTYDGNKLIEMSDDMGFTETYTYTDDLLTQVVEVFEGETYTDNLEYDSSDRLIRVTDGSGVVAYEYTYNADGTITETETSGSQEIYTYVSGNLSTQTAASGDSNYTFTYDTKNNPFKNIHQAEVFELLGYYVYTNNLLTQQHSGSVSYHETIETTYTYNELNYPITSEEQLNMYIDDSLESVTTTATQYFYE